MFLPMIAEDRVVQNNLLQKFDELVGEIGRHESLHGDRDVFGILGLRQGCLYYLQNKRKMVNTWLSTSDSEYTCCNACT